MFIYEPILTDEIIRKCKDMPKFAAECESEYETMLDNAALNIAKKSSDKPFVLISGPSGSGKTTSGFKLKEKLERLGHGTHILSLDNYFHPITDEERPLFEAHKLDLESPARVDCDLLNSQLRDMINGKSVELSEFDFVTSTRRKSEKTLTLKKGELIVIEGIHSLNPSVIEDSDEFGIGVYVSVRSRIEHNKGGESYLLHPSKIRLARRMIRDRLTRNRALSASVAIYNSVELGENKYIMPYKNRADYHIDTFFANELCVYKTLLPSSMPDDEKKHPWLTELFEVLGEIPSMPAELVPYESLIREFIGGGKYE